MIKKWLKADVKLSGGSIVAEYPVTNEALGEHGIGALESGVESAALSTRDAGVVNRNPAEMSQRLRVHFTLTGWRAISYSPIFSDVLTMTKLFHSPRFLTQVRRS